MDIWLKLLLLSICIVENCGSFIPCLPLLYGFCRLAVRHMYSGRSSQQFQIQVRWLQQHGIELRLWLSGTSARLLHEQIRHVFMYHLHLRLFICRFDCCNFLFIILFWYLELSDYAFFNLFFFDKAEKANSFRDRLS